MHGQHGSVAAGASLWAATRCDILVNANACPTPTLAFLALAAFLASLAGLAFLSTFCVALTPSAALPLLALFRLDILATLTLRVREATQDRVHGSNVYVQRGCAHDPWTAVGPQRLPHKHSAL